MVCTLEPVKAFFITMKNCSTCQEEKEFSEFHKNKGTETGYAHDCKECRKLYYQNNSEEIKRWQKLTYKYRRL